MAKPASKKSLFRKIFGGKESKTHDAKPIILEFTKVPEGKESKTHESKPIILEFTKVSESIPQDKKKKANERAIFRLKDTKMNDDLVAIILRIRPFFDNEKLEYERQKVSYLATSNLICVRGKITKFEIIKFRKIFS